ncbi:MAG: 3-dehydroquinate synthase [Bacteroidales bacterium]|nr:3-dehydroquinate synthase [Bacteroidales bacterium]
MQEIYIIYDSNVEAFAKSVESEMSERENCIVLGSLAITADEQHKTLSNVERICRFLMSKGADRNARLLAVGGGVTTDLVGFAAGIYKRGVTFDSFPTTILSQVDAAIGGKNGVNLDGVKNVLGTFLDPKEVYVSSEPLYTLGMEAFLSGAGEMLKTFIIADRSKYEDTVSIFSRLHSEGYTQKAKEAAINALEPLISAAGKIKDRIVRKDPKDLKVRRVLNLGHTYAHAIEWWQHTPEGEKSLAAAGRTPFSHGEAVAIGTIRAAELSERDGIAAKGLKDRLEADFKSCGLPTELPCSVSELMPAFVNDKKVEDDTVDFIYIKDIGKVVIRKKDISDII